MNTLARFVLHATVVMVLIGGMLFAPGAARALIFTVNTTDDLDDGVCDATHCSLREAINEANAAVGLDTILFDSLAAGSVITLDCPLPPLTDSDTKVRANLHPSYAGAPVIGIDAYAITSITCPASGNTPSVWPAFELQGSNNAVRGLAIFNMGSAAVAVLAGSGNLIRDNYIGTDTTGTVALNNGYGILVQEATGTIIRDNVVVGSPFDGILLLGSGVTGTVIRGNKIGTDPSGTLDLGNNQGIRLTPFDAAGVGPSGNFIGTGAVGAGNVISGNSNGIMMIGASLNTIENNLIGTDASGSADLGNTLSGIWLQEGSDNNQILGNTISGNGYFSILIRGANNVVQGNKIGTDSAGSAAIPNWSGVLIESTAGGNLIGGPGLGEGNVISGHTAAGTLPSGVHIFGASTTPNIIQGNFIGTDASGSAAVPNGIGIFVSGGASGDLVLGNVISGNQGHGILMDNATGVVIQGNKIGTNSAGTASLGNGTPGITGYGGIAIGANGAEGVLIGGSGAGEANLVSGNLSEGIILRGANHAVQGNLIGTDLTGTAAIPNGAAGIILSGSTISGWPLENNQIMGNLISGNGGFGISTDGSTDYPLNTVIQNNFIGTDAGGSAALPNGGGGILLQGAGTLVGGAGMENVIAYNGGSGIALYGPPAFDFITGHTFSRNSIFQNDGLGIDLGTGVGGSGSGAGVTPNDPGDGDGGANHLLNYPEFTSVTASLVEGTACDGCVVEVFISDEDPSGHGEGMTFLADGVATGGAFSIPVSLGTCDVVTATATDADGNTSEFSPNMSAGVCATLGPPIIVVLSFVPGVLVGGWVYWRTRKWPGAVAGFIGGTLVGGLILVAVGALVGRARTAAPSRIEAPTATLIQQREPGDLIITPSITATLKDWLPPFQPEIFTLTPTFTHTPTVTVTLTFTPKPVLATWTFTPLPPTATFTLVPPTRTPTATNTPDITGPKVSNVIANPNPIFTSGSTTVSATVNDASGVASVTLYYKKSDAGKYANGGAMTFGGGVYSLVLGPIGAAGTYDIRIYALDVFGNPSCPLNNLPACSGTVLTVNIP